MKKELKHAVGFFLKSLKLYFRFAETEESKKHNDISNADA